MHIYGHIQWLQACLWPMLKIDLWVHHILVDQLYLNFKGLLLLIIRIVSTKKKNQNCTSSFSPYCSKAMPTQNAVRLHVVAAASCNKSWKAQFSQQFPSTLKDFVPLKQHHQGLPSPDMYIWQSCKQHSTGHRRWLCFSKTYCLWIVWRLYLSTSQQTCTCWRGGRWRCPLIKSRPPLFPVLLLFNHTSNPLGENWIQTAARARQCHWQAALGAICKWRWVEAGDMVDQQCQPEGDRQIPEVTNSELNQFNPNN